MEVKNITIVCVHYHYFHNLTFFCTQFRMSLLKEGIFEASLILAGNWLYFEAEWLKLLLTVRFPKPLLTPAAALVPCWWLATILLFILTGLVDFRILCVSVCRLPASTVDVLTTIHM